jgi:hypothetical protein
VVDLRWLRVTAAVEAATLALLLVNLATVHLDAVAALTGPVHGLAWLSTMAIAFLIPLPRAARLLAAVPGVGGLLALRRAESSA